MDAYRIYKYETGEGLGYGKCVFDKAMAGLLIETQPGATSADVSLDSAVTGAGVRCLYVVALNAAGESSPMLAWSDLGLESRPVPHADLEVPVENAALVLGARVRPGAPYQRSFSEERASRRGPLDGRGIHGPAGRLHSLNAEPTEVREPRPGRPLHILGHRNHDVTVAVEGDESTVVVPSGGRRPLVTRR